MQQLALAYRPALLSEVAGQRDAVTVVRKLSTTKRELRVLMFAGQHGIGKTTLARLYAKMLNCEKLTRDERGQVDACGTCSSCVMMGKETHPDYLEKDMGSYGLVADMRQLTEQASMRPSWSSRVFVLDEVHGASREAFNSLLKLLEEPPRTSAFVLCTTDPEKVPHTIVSRSLFMRLVPLSRADMLRKIREVVAKEQIEIQQTVAEALVRSSAGSMRDCYMNLERLLLLSDGEITEDVVRGEFWFQACQAAPALVKALHQGDLQAYTKAQSELSSRAALELLVRDALETVCRIYIRKGKKTDQLVDALWKAYTRIQRGLDPELVMEGLWVDSRPITST